MPIYPLPIIFSEKLQKRTPLSQTGRKLCQQTQCCIKRHKMSLVRRQNLYGQSTTKGHFQQLFFPIYCSPLPVVYEDLRVATSCQTSDFMHLALSQCQPMWQQCLCVLLITEEHKELCIRLEVQGPSGPRLLAGGASGLLTSSIALRHSGHVPHAKNLNIQKFSRIVEVRWSEVMSGALNKSS